MLCIDSAYLFTELIAELRSIENKSHSSNRKQSLGTGICWGVHLVMETWCQGSTQDKILIRIKMLCVGISGSQRGFRSSFDVWFSFLPVLDSGSSCGWHWHILPAVSVKPQSQTARPINYQQQLSNTRHATHLLSQHQENQEKIDFSPLLMIEE